MHDLPGFFHAHPPRSPDPHGQPMRRFDAFAAIDSLHILKGAPNDLISLITQRVGTELHLLAIGPKSLVDQHPVFAHVPSEMLRQADAPSANRIIIPALVNSHTHLDLTSVGPKPFDPKEPFANWLGMVLANRPTDAQGLLHAIEKGVQLAKESGTAIIGDICGAIGGKPSLLTAALLSKVASRAGVNAVGFIEFFGSNASFAMRVDEALEAFAAASATCNGPFFRTGLSPHAPYSVHLLAYMRMLDALQAGGNAATRISTHLAESIDERAFITQGAGQMRDLLTKVGGFDGLTAAGIAKARTPVAHMAHVLERTDHDAALSIVHVNDLDHADIAQLARSVSARQGRGNLIAIYCPHASEYFGAEGHFGPHQYRALEQAGVDVALGTDSIINSPKSGLPLGELSVWSQMCRLSSRDGADPQMLIKMATTNGCKALGVNPSYSLLKPGRVAGLVSVEVGADGVRSASADVKTVLAESLNRRSKAELLESGSVW